MNGNGSNVDLSQFDDSYADAPVEERGFTEVPDGTYRVLVDRAELGHTKSEQKPMLKWTLRILGPTHEGRLLWRNNVITDATLRWLKADLRLCGLDIKLSDLEAHLGQLLDLVLEVTVKTRGAHRNIYFNQRLEGDLDAGERYGAGGNEDVPF